MSVQQIIRTIEQLLKIHTSLMEISKQKTEIVKSGDVNNLQPLLMKEQHHIRALEQAENSREQAVRVWESKQSMLPESTTISFILEHIAGDEDREKLTKVTTKLTNMVTAVKQQEALNRSLIEQSLQFVDMSLGILQPSPKQFIYGTKKQVSRENWQSVFDSKA